MEKLLFLLIFITGVVTSLTDIRKRRIYNKHLIIVTIVGSLIYFLFYPNLDKMHVRGHLLNVMISLMIGFLFYAFKIWAAGDAKLFAVIVFLIPYSLYNMQTGNIFPAFYILSFIFSGAFIYVCLETLYFMWKDKKIQLISKERYSKKKMVAFVFSYLLGVNVIYVCDHLIKSISYTFYRQNQGLIWLVHIFLLMVLYQKVIEKKKKYYILGGTFVVNMLYSLFNSESFNWQMDITYLLIVGIVLLLREEGSKYNYEEIQTEKVMPGMILSYGTVLKFMSSRVKGLPLYTDETTKTRITVEEADAIKRWKTSKYGEEVIVVVRHIPFAPFIFVGTLVFLLLKLA